LNAAVGHELVHRRQIIHKILGTLAYSKMMYSHFLIQHIKSHHKKVATPEDPSTSRVNESLLYFYWRAIPEGYVEVWNYEKKRLEQDNISAFSIYNRAISFNVGHVLYLALVYYFLGTTIFVFHVVYSSIITLMFEAINYIEHYGLERKLQPNGTYESVQQKHSWNAP
jgi:alkane 1-monooxygenase